MELSILNLLTVLLVAWLAGQAAARLGYPSVLGELLAGIVLGPPLLGLLDGSEALAVLAEVGILLMMLYIGMEIDPKELSRASKGGLMAAAGGFITPFVLCYGLMIWAGGSITAAIFVGVAAGVTSLATKSRILVDLHLLDTRIAHVMMAGALAADTVSLIIFAAVIGAAESGNLAMNDLLVVAGKAALYLGVAMLVGLKLLPVLGRRVQKWESLGRTGQFMLVLLIGLVFAEGAELAGMHGILGTFLAGLFLRESFLGRTQATEVRAIVRDASLGFLAPIFFVTAGFAVSLDVLSTDLGLLLGFIALATIGKIAGTALFYLSTGHGWREGLVIGAGMNGRGAVEIIVAQIGLSLGLISQEIFSILVFMAIATTATVPVLLKWGVDWLRQRGELVRSADERVGVLIVGAGPTARALGAVLARTQPVRLLDRNAENVARAEADGMPVTQGNALDEQVLADAGAATVRHLIAMTGNSEVDALIAQMARTAFLVPDVHLLQAAVEGGHRTLLDHVGGTTLFAGPVALAEWDYRVDHGRAERNGLVVEQVTPPDRLFHTLQAPRESLPLALRRGDRYLPFHSGTALEPDDRLILLQVPETPQVPFDRFDRLVARCPVLDLERAVAMDDFFEIAAAACAPRLDMDAAELAARFADREAHGSTVLLPGLAVPHVVIDGRERFEVLLARCREGIAFPDQPEGVHAVFMLIGTPDERTFHLRSLAAIASIVQWPDFEHDWLMAPDAEALRRLVLGIGRRRFYEKPGDLDAVSDSSLTALP